MATPKSKTSRSKRNMRRSHHRAPIATVVKCSQCGSHKQAHRICLSCGYYKGKEILTAVPKEA